jgi:hypothetical protein
VYLSTLLCFKFYLFIHKTSETRCYTIEYFDARIVWTFYENMKGWRLVCADGFCSMCYTVYSRICLNMFLLVTAKFINVDIYSHGSGKTYNLINRPNTWISWFGTGCYSNNFPLWSKYHFTVTWITPRNYSMFYCGILYGMSPRNDTHFLVT